MDEYRDYTREGANREDGYYAFGAGGSQPPEDMKPKKGRAKLVAGVAAGLAVLFLLLGLGGPIVKEVQERWGGDNSSRTENTQAADAASGEAVPEEAAAVSEEAAAVSSVAASAGVAAYDVPAIVREAMPAMVSISSQVTQTTNFFGQNIEETRPGSGSGIIVGISEEELLIVTNYHVIENAQSLEVSFIDDQKVKASVKGADAPMDLAVIAVAKSDLQADTLSAISAAELGDSDSLTLGEPVVAIGNALGYGQSVTAGIISALGRELEVEQGVKGTFIQTDAAINPGNSGGALLNASGQVIGINSNKIGGSVIEGMGYAIPISAAKPIIEDLMTHQTKVKVEARQMGYMGVSLQAITQEFSELYKLPKGIYVTDVGEGTPAQQAGVQVGDIITKFDGNAIRTYEDLVNWMQYYSAGQTVELEVQRSVDGAYTSVTLTLTLGQRPSGRNAG